MIKKNPCRDCEDRHMACHDNCSKYKAWKYEVVEHKEKIQKAKEDYYGNRTKWSDAKANKMRRGKK